MPLGVWDIEFLNANSQRKYPLSELSTGKDTTGTITLPDDVLVALIWSTHAPDTIDPSKFQLTSISIFSNDITLGFGYDGVTVATISVNRTTHTRNKTYQAIGTGDNFFDSVIKVAVGNLNSVLQQPAGTWAFDLAGGRLEPSVIRPDIRGISSMTVISGQDTSDPLQDTIELAAGSNMQLTVSTVNGIKRIRIDAISGEGLNEDCECAGQSIGDPIKRINGIAPNSLGDFIMQGDACLELVPIPNGLQLNEQCATPCCGCQELEIVTQAAQTLQNKVAALEAFTERMQGVVEQLRDSIVGSTLGTPGPCS